jgi:aminoglycoside phosphotransferase
MITTLRLEAALGAQRVDLGGELHLNPVPSRYSTSYPLHDLTVTRDDGERLALLVKDLDWDSMLPAARDAKPRFLYDPSREIDAYRCALDPEALGTARYYASAADGNTGSWIVLERVPGIPLVEIGDRTRWLDAMRWLARFHAHGPKPVDTPSVPLLRHDERFYRTWMDRARQFVPDERLRWVADHYDAVVERLLAQPRVFIHGECYASNVLVDGPRVCPIDWEMAGVGPALVDVAAIVSGPGWDDAAVMAMLGTYRAELGGQVDAELLADLDACRVYLAIQWLGWSPSWAPPAERAHDWLSVAVAAIERLEDHR